jgi:hypothetical protein
VDEVHTLFLGQSHNAGDIQISANRSLAFAHQVSFICLETMNGEAIFLGINRHRPQTEFRRGAKNADGDFTAIGDEQFFKLGSRWF